MTKPEQIAFQFWSEVWRQRRIDRVDELVTEDCVIHAAGEDVASRTAFKAWLGAFHAKVDDLELGVKDLFSVDDRVVTRWRLTGRNRGLLGTEDNQRPIDLTGIAIAIVREPGQIAEQWLEYNAWAVFQSIRSGAAGESHGRDAPG